MIPPVSGKLVPLRLAHGPELQLEIICERVRAEAHGIRSDSAAHPWASTTHSIPLMIARGY